MFAPKKGKLDAKHSLSILFCYASLIYSNFVQSILINPARKIGQKKDEAAKAIA